MERCLSLWQIQGQRQFLFSWLPVYDRTLIHSVQKFENMKVVLSVYKMYLYGDLKLASFKADQRPYRSSAANHVGAADVNIMSLQYK